MTSGRAPDGLAPPIDTDRMSRDLARLGLSAGDTVLVHSSLRAIAGPRSMVVGGPIGLIEALERVVGPEGHLVMPTFSAQYSDPARWRNPPAPPSWWPLIRAQWPAFRPDRAPTRGVGIVPEAFRAIGDVLRSSHPQSSFAASGPDAASIVADHPLDQALGERGPLGRLYERDARVLLMGCGWSSCTSFHLAEHRMRPPPPSSDQGASVLRDGQRVWVRWSEPAVHSEDFEQLGDALEEGGHVRTGLVGRAPSRLCSLRTAVDFAVPWLQRHR